MSLNRLLSPNMIALHPETGRPVSLGYVFFYSAGTTALKSAYLDRDGTVPAANPVRLDNAGMCDVYLDGLYRVEVRDASGRVLYDRDNVSSESTGGGGTVDGALLAVNNLADLSDYAAARQVLGLAKQDSATDATAGRLISVGGFGLGGSAPRVQAADALTDSTLPTGWVSVALADVTTVGGPSGAPAGVCHTMKHSGGALAQAYYPVSGDNGAPWRRFYSGGTWTAWRRDQAAWSETTGWYSRHADGTQVCYLNKLVCSFDNSANLLATWTFPIQFSGRPHFVTAALRPEADGANATAITTNCTPGMADILAPATGAINPSSCHFRVYRHNGGADFVAGDKVWLMCRAEGRWY